MSKKSNQPFILDCLYSCFISKYQSILIQGSWNKIIEAKKRNRAKASFSFRLNLSSMNGYPQKLSVLKIRSTRNLYKLKWLYLLWWTCRKKTRAIKLHKCFFCDVSNEKEIPHWSPFPQSKNSTKLFFILLLY